MSTSSETKNKDSHIHDEKIRIWNSGDRNLLPTEITWVKSSLEGNEDREGLLVKSPRHLTIKPFEEKTVGLDLWVELLEGFVMYFEPIANLEDQEVAIGTHLFDSTFRGEVAIKMWNHSISRKKIKIKRGEVMAVMYILKGGKEEYYKHLSNAGRTVMHEGELGDLVEKYKSLVLEGKIKKDN